MDQKRGRGFRSGQNPKQTHSYRFQRRAGLKFLRPARDESYGDASLASFINENFVSLSVHVKENPKNFRRFDAFWTPTVLILDPDGKERWRLEGYLPKDDFRPFLEMGLARLALARKDWAEAERRFAAIAENCPDSIYAPQAVYYRGVSRYSSSHDSVELRNTARALDEKYPGSEWQLRSIPWGG